MLYNLREVITFYWHRLRALRDIGEGSKFAISHYFDKWLIYHKFITVGTTVSMPVLITTSFSPVAVTSSIVRRRWLLYDDEDQIVCHTPAAILRKLVIWWRQT